MVRRRVSDAAGLVFPDMLSRCPSSGAMRTGGSCRPEKRLHQRRILLSRRALHARRDIDGARRGDAKRLAEAVHLSMVDGLKAKNRGVRQAPFVVLLGAEMPAILVEIGFISHPVEGKLLAEAAHQEKIALALRDAVHSFQQRVLSKRAAPTDTKPAVVPPPQ